MSSNPISSSLQDLQEHQDHINTILDILSSKGPQGVLIDIPSSKAPDNNVHNQKTLMKKRKYGEFIPCEVMIEGSRQICKKVKRTPPEDIHFLANLEPPKPELPVPNCFNSIQEYAHLVNNSKSEIEEILKVDGVLLVNKTFLSPNNLQRERFQRSRTTADDCVEILWTDRMKKLLTKINDEVKRIEMHVSYHIRGPSGIGKSYLLASYVLLLRGTKNNRILYINNPTECQISFNHFFANEIVYCFWAERENLPLPERVRDLEGASPLEKWYNYLTSELMNPKRVIYCLQTLKKYYDENHTDICILFIIDQMNVLFRPGQEALAERFHAVMNRSYCHKKIISASDNNEGYEVEKGSPSIYLSNILEKSDMIWYLNYFFSSSKLKINLPLEYKDESGNLKKVQLRESWKENSSKYPELLRILDATKSNPNELSEMLKIQELQEFDDIDKLIEAYFNQRIIFFSSLHSEYRNKIFQPHQLDQIYRVLTIADTAFLDSTCVTYDRNLFYHENDPKGKRFFTLCPAAAKALEKDYPLYRDFQDWSYRLTKSSQYSDFLAFILEQKDEFSNSMRGAALEKFIINSLKTNCYSSSTVVFKCWSVTKSWLSPIVRQQKPKFEPEFFNILIDSYHYFATEDLTKILDSLLETSEKTKPTLLIPNSPQFPLIDFLILETKKPYLKKEPFDVMLYLFQVTINVNNHEKGDREIAETLVSLGESQKKSVADKKVLPVKSPQKSAQAGSIRGISNLFNGAKKLKGQESELQVEESKKTLKEGSNLKSTTHRHHICQAINEMRLKYHKKLNIKTQFIWLTYGSDSDLEQISWKGIDKDSKVAFIGNRRNNYMFH